MTNSSCTLTPAPVMRCGCIGALILSATGRAHISGEYTRPIVPPSRGLLASTPRNIDHACARGWETRLPAVIKQGGFFLCKARTCLLCFKTQTCVLLSSRQTTGGPWGLLKEAETSRPAPPFHQKKQRTQEPSARCISSRMRAPQIPGVWVSVPSRGCYAARCQCDAPGLAGWPNRTVVRAGSHSRRWTAWYHSRRQIYSRGVMGA